MDERKETYPLDEVINSLYESSPATVTIVDMKAGTSRSTQEWFSSVPWDALRKLDVDVYVHPGSEKLNELIGDCVIMVPQA